MERSELIAETAHRILDSFSGDELTGYLSLRMIFGVVTFQHIKDLAIAMGRWGGPRDGEPKDSGHVLPRIEVAEVVVEKKTCRTDGCDNPEHAGTGVCDECLKTNGE